MFGFGSNSPFFHDEYLFNDGERPRKKRKQRDDDAGLTERKRCLDCGAIIEVGRGDNIVSCGRCSGRFMVRRER